MSTPSEAALPPCRKDTPKLNAAEIAAGLQALPQWQHLVNNHIDQLQRTYAFADFADALQFTNQLANIAEAANHHPALTLEWGKVTVTWWTHTIHGLHQNDLIMAQRCDDVFAAA